VSQPEDATVIRGPHATYFVSDDRVLCGASHGNGSAWAIGKATGALQKMFSLALGLEVFGSTTLTYGRSQHRLIVTLPPDERAQEEQLGTKGGHVTLEQTAPGTFEPSKELRGVCSFDDLAQFRVRVHTLGKLPATTLIDARPLAEYLAEEVRGQIGGPIPGAANIEWSNLMAGAERTRMWRSPPEIHAILRIAGIDKEGKLAVYDQAGGRSAHLYFTLWLMGFEQVRNYVGGWREYSKKDDVEIEK